MRLYLYISIILFSSCFSQEKCLKRFPPETVKETVTKIEYRDTTIQGATIEKVIKKDSLIILPGETITYVDSSGVAELSFYRNKYGELVAECTAKDRTIQKLSKQITESKKEVVTVKERYVPFFIKALLLILSLLSLPSLFKVVKSLIKPI